MALGSEEEVSLEVIDQLVLSYVRDVYAPSATLNPSEIVFIANRFPEHCGGNGVNHGGNTSANLIDYKRMREVCDRARQCVLNGDLNSAIELAQTAPGGSGQVLEDRRLLFKMYKQIFVEQVLSASNPEQVEKALAWCREYLAPAALEAYPEAYDEFKQAMLCVVSEGTEALSSMSDRTFLAGAFSQSMRKITRVPEPQMLLLLRYLIIIHNLYCATADGPESPVQELAFALFEGHDASMLPEEGIRGCFPEVDVQALAGAVNISRQEAIEALKHTEGDIHFALKNELTRIKVNMPLTEELLVEYIAYRGLFEGNEEIWNSMENKECILYRYATIWKKTYQSSINTSLSCDSHKNTITNDSFFKGNFVKYVIALQIAEKLVKGKSQDAIEILSQYKTLNFNLDVELKFELKRYQVLEYLKSGMQDEALEIAREDLGTIAKENPKFLPKFKDTMLAFCVTEDVLENDREKAIKTLFDTVVTTLGIPQPRLIQLFTCSLEAHSSWFTIQQCKDRFEDVMGIPHLKASGSEIEKGEREGPQESMPDGVNEDISQLSEISILTLMEFMALTRAQAIELLLQHGGNLEQCLDNILG